MKLHVGFSALLTRQRMAAHVESIGYGLFWAGAVLIVLYFLGAYIRGDLDAIYFLIAQHYWILLALAPGHILVWLGRRISRP